MLTLFEELKGSDASPELVQVHLVFVCCLFVCLLIYCWKDLSNSCFCPSRVSKMPFCLMTRLIQYSCKSTYWTKPMECTLCFPHPGFRGCPVFSDQGCEKYWMWTQSDGGHVQQVHSFHRTIFVLQKVFLHLIQIYSLYSTRERESHSAHLASIEAEMDHQVARVSFYPSQIS